MSPIPPPGPHPPAPPLAGAERPAIQRAAEHLAAGRPAEAAASLGRLVASAPTYAAAHVLQAVALEAAGHPAEALAAWHRAAFLVPGSPLVQRERQRLMASVPDAAGPPAPPGLEPGLAAGPAVDSDAAAVPSAAERPDDRSADEEPLPDSQTPLHDVEADGPAGAEPDEPDFPSLQTLSVDDLAVALPDLEGDFDPDGFDFSAFDL
ncbi:MAG TPA: hypothetical protein VF576_01950, partial [Rubricoccaceae bacterium]